MKVIIPGGKLVGNTLYSTDFGRGKFRPNTRCKHTNRNMNGHADTDRKKRVRARAERVARSAEPELAGNG